MNLIDCREAVARMWAYLSEGLGSRDVGELEAHLDVCERCCGELEFGRHLRERVSTAEVAPLPESVRDRVARLLNSDAEQNGQP